MPKTIEVEVDCEEVHCDDVSRVEDCPHFAQGHAGALSAAFREVGPADERRLDWHRSDAEPWRTIARKLDR